MVPKPDCCKRPHLHTIRIVEESSDSPSAIFRCEACETYWITTLNEWAVMKGDDEMFGAFKRLAADQAIKMLRVSR